jgi:hypothetical protein
MMENYLVTIHFYFLGGVIVPNQTCAPMSIKRISLSVQNNCHHWRDVCFWLLAEQIEPH